VDYITAGQKFCEFGRGAVNRWGMPLNGHFVVAVMIIAALGAAFAPGGLGIVAADSAADPVQVIQPLEDVRVGLGAEPIIIELIGRFDDPVFDLARFDTVMGTIDVKLFQAETPLTVANFLNYVNEGAYTNSFFHRATDPKFVVQGGGFAFYNFDEAPDAEDYISIPKDEPVVNEPGISNVRGTIAMAKVSGDPNSATNQWFFNVIDNSGNLDSSSNNGGFTVFGQVIHGGMSVVDAIADLPKWDFGDINSAFGTLPLIRYADIGILPDEDDLVMVWGIEQMPELSFTVNNDRPDLVTASVVNDSLHLDLAKNQSGVANVTVRATSVLDGRYVEDVFEVVIEEWGDLDANGEVNLADAILALNIQAGKDSDALRADYASSSADVNGDGKAEVSEAAYVLRKVSGLNQ
jgi:cyclophilin family peptidyl-prolyl cis-trans isomerase